MRALAILNGFEQLQADEELTENLLVGWLVDALEINENIPVYTIDAAAGKVVNNAFWTRVRSETVRMVFPLVTRTEKIEMYEVVAAIVTVFETTIERPNMFAFWHQISRFLKDLQAKCTNEIFMILSPKIGVRLLSKYVKIDNFERNEDIMKSMEFLLQCGSVLAGAVKKRRHEYKCEKMYIEYMSCVDEFLDLLQDHHIFTTYRVFYAITYNILHKGTCYIDALTRTKYLTLIHHKLEDRREAPHIFDYCTKSGSIKRFEAQTWQKYHNFNEHHRQMVFKILKQLLKYSRDNNLQMNCDWVSIFGHTLYTDNVGVRQASLDLLLLEAELNFDNEIADQYTLLEKAITAYRLQTDDTHAMDFIDLFQSHVDFVNCKKLFHLFRKYAAEDPGMVIISIIDAALKKLAASDRNYDRHAKLTETVFLHITYVEGDAQLLHRLIDSIDLPNAKNNQIFHERILLLEEPVLKAFYECRQYGTAIGLMEIFKEIGVDNNKLTEMFQNLVTNCIKRTTENGHRDVLIQMLAANDIFGCFEKIHPVNKHVVYKFFKDRCFPLNRNTALYVALSVNILTVYNSSPSIPNMTPDEIRKEAEEFHKYLDESVFRGEPKERNLSDIMFSIAFLDLHATFRFEVNVKVLDAIFHDLSALSDEYRQTFKIYELQYTNDLTLIKKFWRSVNNFCVFVERCPVWPSKLIAWYTDADVHLIDCFEQFIVTLLNFPSANNLYGLFAGTVCDCLKFLKASDIKPLVTKLFQFIRKSNFAFDTSTIAMELFLGILDLLPNGTDKPKTIWAVLCYLYQHGLQDQSREQMLEVVDQKVQRSVGDEKDKLNDFLEYLKKEMKIDYRIPN